MPDSTPSSFPGFPGFDPQRFLSLMSRALRGPEQAMHVYRELLGLEGGSRERAVDFVAGLARGYGVDATVLFESILRFGPTSTVRVAAAAYLAEQGREDTVLEVLESLQPPMLTTTLVTGLLDVLGSRPATPDRIRRLVAFANRFDDEAQYTTLTLGGFTGHDVKRAVRRTLAEGLLRRDAAEAVSWPRESA
jgi:hypothetical protein